MKANEMTIKKAVAMAIEDVNANIDNRVCKDVRESAIFRVAESIFDGLPYKWVNGGFRPMDLRKPHSESFYEALSMEIAQQR